MDKHSEYAISGIVYIFGKLYRKYKALTIKKEKSILVTQVEAIGDMVCTVPFLRGLRKHYPNHKITLVCNPVIHNMMEPCPYVDEFLIFDARPPKKHIFMTHLKRSLRFVADNFSNRNYEIAVSLTIKSYPEQYLCLLSGAGRRVASSELLNIWGEHDYFMGMHDIFFNDVCKDRTMYHEVDYALKLLKHLLSNNDCVLDDNLELWITEADEHFIDELFRKSDICEDKLNVIVNLSTSGKEKDWNVQNYVEVCRSINSNYEVNLILIGAGKAAVEYADEFVKQIPTAYNFVNKTTLRQTACIIKRSKIYFGGDTGPLHMAVAFHLDGVALYKDATDARKSPRFDEWFAPWKAPIRIVQPDHNLPGCEYECTKGGHCINQISPQTVWAFLDDILKKYV